MVKQAVNTAAKQALISPYTWLHGHLGHSCLCVVCWCALWIGNLIQNKHVRSISMFIIEKIMRISVWIQNSGIQIEHIHLTPIAKIYFDKNSSHRFDAIPKLVKDAYSPFCRHKILRTDVTIGLHLNFFMKRFHH